MTLPGQAVNVPLMAFKAVDEALMSIHFAGEVKQVVCAETQRLPPVQAGPKLTVTVVPFPITVASPVIDHKYCVAPVTAAIAYELLLLAQALTAPEIAAGVLIL